jgi:hypothetical protein
VNTPHRTHYQTLGITRNAKAYEVQRAYDRIRHEMRSEAAAPDPRRLLQVQTAYEVLHDEARRAAYDEELARGRVERASGRPPWMVALAGGAVVLLGLVAWLGSRPRGPRPVGETEILSLLTPAVGRVHAVDMSGNARPLGLAFAIAPGRLAMGCGGLAPNMELVVRIGSRDVQARAVDAAGRHGYCVVHAAEAGSWPLAVESRAPAAGDRVYAVRLADSGDISLLAGRVQRIERGARGAVLEISGDAAREEAGGPLVDEWGRALAIADGHGRGLAIDEGDARSG